MGDGVAVGVGRGDGGEGEGVTEPVGDGVAVGSGATCAAAGEASEPTTSAPKTIPTRARWDRRDHGVADFVCMVLRSRGGFAYLQVRK